MSDCNMAIQDIYTLFIQDGSISDAKKKNLTSLYKPASSRLLFLENAFPYMDNYNYHKGMNGIIQELTGLLKTKNIGTDSDRALLLDFQATLETKPEKAIKLEKDALAQIETITADNARCFQPSCQSRWTLPHERSSRSCKRTHGKKYLTA